MPAKIDPNLIQTIVIATLRRILDVIQQQRIQTHDPALTLDARFLLDVLHDNITTTLTIIPKLFPEIDEDHLTHFLPQLYEEYELIHLEYPSKHTRFYYLGCEEYQPQLTVEMINHFYRRQAPGAVSNNQIISWYQDKLYHYNKHSKVLQNITTSNDQNIKRHYEQFKNNITAKNPYCVHLATFQERQLLSSISNLKTAPESAPRENWTVISTLLPHISAQLDNTVTAYQERKKTALINAAKTTLLLMGGFALLISIPAFFRYLTGHALPEVIVLLIMKCSLLAAASLLIIGLGIALYFHHQHATFTQMQTDLHQTIHCEKQYQGQTRAIQCRSIGDFFKTQLHQTTLQPLLFANATPTRVIDNHSHLI